MRWLDSYHTWLTLGIITLFVRSVLLIPNQPATLENQLTQSFDMTLGFIFLTLMVGRTVKEWSEGPDQ